MQVKILKRPTETEGEGLSRAAEQASSEYKTLAQREAEYASARYIFFKESILYCIGELLCQCFLQKKQTGL